MAPPALPTNEDELIRGWRQSRRHLHAGRLDELEDHLRSEMQQLKCSDLTAQERFTIARSRLNEAYPPFLGRVIQVMQRYRRFTTPVFTALLVVITTWCAVGGSWEIMNEIDDWLALQIGDNAQDAIADNLLFIVGVPMLMIWAGIIYTVYRYRQYRARIRLDV